MSDTSGSHYIALAQRLAETRAAQLLRDLQLINERTQRELGPLPHGGLLEHVKRKPKPAPWVQPVQPVPALDDNAHTAPRVPMPKNLFTIFPDQCRLCGCAKRSIRVT
ncbi:hypothetical protein [Xanthomonas campestris]|uniref:hypothetical protein n=1 Tax=Xanthomonas campestris TaxID=339 RepID=UPI001F2A4D5F|nr:hypothetical protein [Xanthomonas campestris]